MTIYSRIVFLQGDEAYEPLQILKDQGADIAMEYMKQWDYGDSYETSDTPSHGASDDIYEDSFYILSWNDSLNYIGLDYKHKPIREV